MGRKTLRCSTLCCWYRNVQSVVCSELEAPKPGALVAALRGFHVWPGFVREHTKGT